MAKIKFSPVEFQGAARSLYLPENGLLSVSSDAKTVKGEKIGFLTGVLYLAAADNSGFNVCALAGKAQCAAGCLFKAGRGIMSNVEEGRLNRTLVFFHHRGPFMVQLARNIASLVKRARKAGQTPLIRLNGTSDIKWERVDLVIDAETAYFIGCAPGYYENIMSVFPDVQFYDYTKIPNRDERPANYDLTFSYSGVESFAPYVAQAMAKRMRIAVVFRTARNMPKYFKGLPVINGDETDVRHLDPQGVIVGLYAKGPAQYDESGFVVDMPGDAAKLRNPQKGAAAAIAKAKRKARVIPLQVTA